MAGRAPSSPPPAGQPDREPDREIDPEIAHELGPWRLVHRHWRPASQAHREALCTLGNGYFAVRGAAEEARAGGPHYPGMYLAGGYDRARSQVAGREIENEDLVNWPSWLFLSFRPAGGDWLDLDRVEVLDLCQELDLRAGVLARRLHLRDRDGRESLLCVRRLVHMDDPHVGAIEWTLTPRNWSGAVELCSAIDGTVTNQGVARYRALESRHLDVLDMGAAGEDGMFLVARTRQSHLVMAQAARTRVFRGDTPVPVERRTIVDSGPAPAGARGAPVPGAPGGAVEQRMVVECAMHQPLRVEKVVAVFTSRDRAISEPREEACAHVRRLGRFGALLHTHRRAWARLWARADIQLEGGDETTQSVLRLHVFHLLQTTSMHTIDLDAGVPARGLHGEAYRGHVFWDELFIFPFLDLRIPELTRALLMYRYRRLPEARRGARAAGYRGAMFPWQSGSNGREESQVLHLNPRSGRWLPDHTYRQRHVNAAIAYNVWQYYQATGDVELLSFYGAEMILDIARFWSSIAEDGPGHGPARGRYVIRGVVGPDEFHTHYPGSDEPGIDNNAYTNVMAAWCLRCALDVLALLTEDRRAELLDLLDIDDRELARWDDISRRMFVPMDARGIILQFEGYDRLAQVDWAGLRRRHGDIHRLDRILEAEGDDVNRYQAAKQADVLMLFYLFSSEELAGLFQRLGYSLAPAAIPANIAHYLERSAHGSTLSRVVHAWVMARSMRERSWVLFQEALASDIGDIQGGTTSEGIHLGAMAGTVDLMQRCYTGIVMRDGVLWLDPRLPGALSCLHLSIQYHGHHIALRITHHELRVSLERGRLPSVQIGFHGAVYTMRQGAQKVFSLQGG